MRSFGEIWRSNIFQKWVMAITGLLLVLFLIGHLSGNLLLFLGPEAMNAYAHGLRELFHGASLWIARLGLLFAFGLHIWAAIRLTQRNASARPSKYVKTEPRTSTLASRSMAISGLSLLVYLIYHLAHFTWGLAHAQHYAGQPEWTYTLESGAVVPDVYRMMVSSFQEPLIVVVYALAMILLGLHLNHAISSAFQTLGVTNQRLRPLVRTTGPLLGAALTLGFLSLPFVVVAGLVK